MKISVLGTGYVGLVSGVCYARLGHEVICVDKDVAKIELLNSGEVPIYEPGLKELMAEGRKAECLSFTTDVAAAVRHAELIVIAVGTPPLPGGEANLGYIEHAAREIALAMNGHKIIAVKSTVPVGTNDHVAELIRQLSPYPFDIVSLPEFLREGSAIRDTLHPDRIVIGAHHEAAAAAVAAVHEGLTDHIVLTDIRSAEMIKYASNAFLATKISFINEIANICEKVGADVTKVAHGMGFDRRIGHAFLRAGIGYGGSCFPKDTDALIQIAGHVNYEFKLLKSVVEVNRDQRFNIMNKLRSALGERLPGKAIAVWGLAFKPDTDDIRDSPALDIMAELLAEGAQVRAYDPVAQSNMRKQLGDQHIAWCEGALAAATGADAVCLLTEWREFSEVDLQALKKGMRQPIFIDGRNVFEPEAMQAAGFAYLSIGRPAAVHREPTSTGV